MSESAAIVDGTYTAYDDAPRVAVQSVPEGPLMLSVSYRNCLESAPVLTQCRIIFDAVYDYRWFRSGQHMYTDPGQYAFGLIEVFRSELREQFLDHTLLRRERGARLGWVSEDKLRHWRLGFDHFGTFDVLCLDMAVEIFPANDSRSM